MGFLIDIDFVCFFSLSSLITDIAASWEEWWTYDGISGNKFLFENGKTRSLMQLFGFVD